MGSEEGQFGNLIRRVQTVQRMVFANGRGSSLRQASQVVWPQVRTRGMAVTASYGCRHTGHSGGSASSMVRRRNERGGRS